MVAKSNIFVMTSCFFGACERGWFCPLVSCTGRSDSALAPCSVPESRVSGGCLWILDCVQVLFNTKFEYAPWCCCVLLLWASSQISGNEWFCGCLVAYGQGVSFGSDFPSWRLPVILTPAMDSTLDETVLMGSSGVDEVRWAAIRRRCCLMVTQSWSSTTS